jgi:hypothetical protein
VDRMNACWCRPGGPRSAKVVGLYPNYVKQLTRGEETRLPLRSSLTHARYQGGGADFEAQITSSDVYTTLVVPALLADVSNDASWRYLEFFTANIRNRSAA